MLAEAPTLQQVLVGRRAASPDCGQGEEEDTQAWILAEFSRTRRATLGGTSLRQPSIQLFKTAAVQAGDT